MVSTWITKPEVHAEDVAILVKNAANSIDAKNDDIFAGDFAEAA